MKRALLLLDAIVRGLELLKISIEGDCAVIAGEKVRFGVYERADREEVDKAEYSWNRYKYAPNGILTFRIVTTSKTYSWSDEPAAPLESRVKFLIKEILVAGDKLKAYSDRLAAYNRQWEEERWRHEEAQRVLAEQQAELRRRQEAEMHRRQRLEHAADSWDRSGRLLQFVAECQTRLDPANEQATGFLEWARAHAKRLDPFQNGFLESAISELAAAPH